MGGLASPPFKIAIPQKAYPKKRKSQADKLSINTYTNTSCVGVVLDVLYELYVASGFTLTPIGERERE